MLKTNNKSGADIGLPLKWVRRGVFLPITKTINSSIFRLISVTHEQDSMPVKYNAFFKYKLHPNNYHEDDKFVVLCNINKQCI